MDKKFAHAKIESGGANLGVKISVLKYLYPLVAEAEAKFDPSV